jgi:hypothetical protein
VFQAQPIAGRGLVAQAKARLIDCVIQLGNFLFEKAKIEQMRGLEAAKSVQNEIIVIGHPRPKLAE